MTRKIKPVVLITGSEGNVGHALRQRLKKDYTVVGLDRPGHGGEIGFDLTSPESLKHAFQEVRKRFGESLAAVIHLAAYFDFSGEDSPLYRSVNEKGTDNLLKALQDFKVDRFIYSSTMLVHEPMPRGQLLHEEDPIGPKWAYPRSKAHAEAIIRRSHGNIPFTILRLAGLYDECSAVPTLSHQISRIYQKDFKSHFYAGDLMAGQSFIHKDDMAELFKRVVDRRNQLPSEHALLAGA
jgi:nucleoside-diphosphate-sugar epimerase